MRISDWRSDVCSSGLGVPRNADWRDAAHASLDGRARAYLDINCGHCHNEKGPADTSGLWLDVGDHPPRHLGLCKPSIAAGQGTGGHRFGIVPGKRSEENTSELQSLMRISYAAFS